MKEPVDHILRPQLPWRSEGGVTECGLNAAKVSVLTREQHFQRIKDYGRQRTAMLTCMTCMQTAERWGEWADDPRKAVGREIEWETGWRAERRGQRLRDELLAIAALIEGHRDEFNGLLASIERRRQWNAEKDARAKKVRAPKLPTRIL